MMGQAFALGYVPVLSLRQPWVWIITELGKSLENRTWNTRYRGPVLIHASKAMTREECADALYWSADHAGTPRHDPSSPVPPGWPGIANIERGGICAYAEIVGVVPPIATWRGTGETGRADLFDVVRGMKAQGVDVTNEELRSWWMTEQFAFVLRNVKKFPMLMSKGSLGLWRADAELERVALAAARDGVCPCQSKVARMGAGHVANCPSNEGGAQ